MRFSQFAVSGVLLASFLTPAGAAPNLPAAASVPFRATAPGLPPTVGVGRERLPGASQGRGPRSANGRTAVTGYTIYDLGMPLGLEHPTPFAINQRGDVALQFCPVGRCNYDSYGNPTATSSLYPYLYDALSARLSPLARFGTYRFERYFPYALNDRGLIVGSVVFSDGNSISGERAVIWKRVGSTGSTIAFLDARPGSYGIASSINESGVVVGTDGFPVRFTASGPVRLVTRGPFDSFSGAATSVNDAGIAVGNVTAVGGTYTSYIFNSPTGTPVPGVPNPNGYSLPTTAIAINSAGNIVGSYVGVNSGSNKAINLGYFYDAKAGTTRTIDYSDVDATYINGFNDRDQIVGYVERMFTPSGPYLDGTLLANLLPPSADLSPATAVAINNRDQIVGQAYSFKTKSERAYLLEPTGTCRLEGGRCP